MKKDKIKILGIDPGFGRVGFGIIKGGGGEWRAQSYGCIETDAGRSFLYRLEYIHDTLGRIVKKYRPDLASVEDLFFYKNAKTAIQVGQARGVILLTLRQAGLPVEEFTPLQIKQALTGYGRAEKKQIQRMVAIQLNMEKKPCQDDAADALAAALTCAVSLRMRRVLGKSKTG